jgi:hypothetical protein
MAIGREHGMNNQEGMLTPRTSPWGQALALHSSKLIDRQIPIGSQSRGFRGNVGAMTTRSASVQALFVDGGYFGDLPLSQQDMVYAPEPWNRSR